VCQRRVVAFAPPDGLTYWPWHLTASILLISSHPGALIPQILLIPRSYYLFQYSWPLESRSPSLLLAPRITYSSGSLCTSGHISLWFPCHLGSHIPSILLASQVTYPFNTLGTSGHISLQYSWHLGSQGPFNTLGTSEYLSSLYPALNFRAPSARRHHLAQPEDPQ